MKVLVTGASGFLGRHVVTALMAAGDVVRGLVRRADAQVVHGMESVAGDLRREDDLRRAVAGMEAVVHCGARVETTGDWDEFAAVNIDATGLLIDRAAAAGVKRFVHVSSLSVYGIDRDGATVSEDSPYEDGAADRGYYSRSKLAADRLAMRAAHRGAPVTVVRPGLLYGAGRRPPLGRRHAAVGGVRFILGSPGYLLPLAYAANVADAIALALRQPGAIGRAYTLVDHEVPMRDYLRLYRSIAGARWRPIHVPARLPLAVIPPASFAFRLLRRRFPVSAHQIERATWSAHFDCTRARTELGWTPRVPLAVAMRVALEAADGATAQAPAEKPDGLSYEAHRSAG